MEPRVFTRGNPGRAISLRRSQDASMEPRVFTRGNVEETGRLGGGRRASMEPRVFTRGNIPSKVDYFGAKSSFNGATRLHAWKRCSRLPSR